MEKSVENQLKALVGHSGNSDVDVVINIDIETKSIAYGMLCSLYAKGELSESELDKAIQKLNSLIEKDKKEDKVSGNIPKIFEFPRPRRNWI